MDAKAAADSRAEITHLMGVTDANNRGNIHGGTIMKLADEAAALAAIKHSRQRVVTVGMDRMVFPVPICGDADRDAPHARGRVAAGQPAGRV